MRGVPGQRFLGRVIKTSKLYNRPPRCWAGSCAVRAAFTGTGLGFVANGTLGEWDGTGELRGS